VALASAVARNNVISLFGHEILSLGPRQRGRCVEGAIEHWRSAGFPYDFLSSKEKEAHYQAVARAPLLKLVDGATLGTSSVGLKLANSYHPQMWHATSHGHRRSPYDYFQDDHHLRLMLTRAPRFWPSVRCWTAQAIRNLARIYSGGRVANFRPVVARNIVCQLSGKGDVVLDFSAGYGGRLLACLTLGRAYIGIDPAQKQVDGLRKMCRQLARHATASVKILHGCAEDVLPVLPRDSIDLVFSSPPFFNLEIYSEEPTQSSSRYRTYECWRCQFLERVVEQARRVLRRKGYFAINVSPRGKYPIARDTLAFASARFAYRATIHVQMTARPLQRAKAGSAYRIEPIYVFQKR
jgi:DNA modification methylase